VFAIRRRQGVVEYADGPLDGHSGVTVLMRSAAELIRRQNGEI
jgi:hypothetical protein